MMKRSLPLFSAALMSCAASVFLITEKKSSPEFDKNVVGNASELMDDPDGAAQWEFNRLADPVTGKIPFHIRESEIAFAKTLPNDGMIPSRNVNWISRGPSNVGGRTRAFGIDVANENIMLAANVSGSMWRTTNGGTTWTPVTPVSDYHGFTSLTQDVRPGHTTTWYAGTGEAYGQSASDNGAYYLGTGLYKSDDNGLTWTVLDTTATHSPQAFNRPWDQIWNTAIDVSDTLNRVYAAAAGSIMESVDGGNSWVISKGTTAGTPPYFTDVAVTSTGIVYSTFSSDNATYRGIWRSDDRGASWTKIIPVNLDSGYSRIVIGIDLTNENKIYFFANTPNHGSLYVNYRGDKDWNSLWRYTYVSGNGSGAGGVWEDLSINLPRGGGPFDGLQTQGGYDMVVRVHPADSNMVYIGGCNVYRSSTAFNDSTSTTYMGGYEHGATLPIVHVYANHHPDQHTLTFLPSNPNVLFSTNDGGVFKTLNDLDTVTTWISLNNNYLTSQFYTVTMDHGTPGNDVVVAGAQDNGSWFTNNSNPATPWVTPRGGDGSYCQIEDGRGRYYFSIQLGRTMMAQVDAAGNIDSFARIDPIGGINYQFINPFALDPADQNKMYMAAGSTIWRNNDLHGIPYAGNWDSITTNWSTFPDTVSSTYGTITAIGVSKASPAHRVFYGTSSRRVYRVDNASAGSPTRVDVTPTTFPPSGSSISCICVDPWNGNHVVLTFSNYSIYSVWTTWDGGTTWSKAGGNLEATVSGSGNGPSIRWSSILHVADGTIYLLATSAGVFATDTLDGLNTVWVQQATNLIGNQVCDMIDVRESDGQVVIASHASGIYSTQLYSVADVLAVKNISSPVSSLNLFPNPATDFIHAEYSIFRNSVVRFEIRNLSGELIFLSEGKNETAGIHREKISLPASVPPGIYLFTIRTGEFSKSQQLILVR